MRAFGPRCGRHGHGGWRSQRRHGAVPIAVHPQWPTTTVAMALLPPLPPRLLRGPSRCCRCRHADPSSARPARNGLVCTARARAHVCTFERSCSGRASAVHRGHCYCRRHDRCNNNNYGSSNGRRRRRRRRSSSSSISGCGGRRSCRKRRGNDIAAAGEPSVVRTERRPPRGTTSVSSAGHQLVQTSLHSSRAGVAVSRREPCGNHAKVPSSSHQYVARTAGIAASADTGDDDDGDGDAADVRRRAATIASVGAVATGGWRMGEHRRCCAHMMSPLRPSRSAG